MSTFCGNAEDKNSIVSMAPMTCSHSFAFVALSNTYTKSGMSRMKKAWTEDSEHISPNESTRSSPGRFEGMLLHVCLDTCENCCTSALLRDKSRTVAIFYR